MVYEILVLLQIFVNCYILKETIFVKKKKKKKLREKKKFSKRQVNAKEIFSRQ